MSIENDKLVELLIDLKSSIVAKLVSMAYSLRVRHPRPRASMHRFVICDEETVSLVEKIVDKKYIRVRLALPISRTAKDLYEKIRLEVYDKDGVFFFALPFKLFTAELSTRIQAEVISEACYYAREEVV